MGRQHGAIGRYVGCKPLERGMTMKNTVKKLRLNKQQVRVLVAEDLTRAAGGWIRPPLTWSCPQPSASECCPRTA
jgi:hypothetical protein